MTRLGKALGWYQRKIGAYDTQAWECSVEQRILRGLSHATFTKKSTKPPSQLIDVDLVRGSLFPKAKPTQGLLTVARLGLERALFLPLHCTWWARHTSGTCVCALLALYASMLAGLWLYVSAPSDHEGEEHISANELIAPATIFVILSVLHSHIVATQMPTSSTSSRRNVRVARSQSDSSKRSSSHREDDSQSSSEGEERLRFRAKQKDMTSETTSRLLDNYRDTSDQDSIYSQHSQSGDGWLADSSNSEEEDGPFSPEAYDSEIAPAVLLNPGSTSLDKVSCTLWRGGEPRRAELSVLDISSAIIARAEGCPDSLHYCYVGGVMAFLLALLPAFYRFSMQIPIETRPVTLSVLSKIAFGETSWERSVVTLATAQRAMLGAWLVFLLCVAQDSLRIRGQYAKLFSQLTSSRRARKNDLPHFRLHKVCNIKVWLSVRSYLKRRGPQRSVDVIVSASSILCLVLVSLLSVELLKDPARLYSPCHVEAFAWCLLLGVFLTRFLTLGCRTARKYSNLSVLLTEQINLYLQIEQKPNKKEELMVANSVLKLAADLIKELEGPVRISGLSTNPLLFTLTKVVVLSAISGVLSEALGFKLKLHKIKIK